MTCVGQPVSWLVLERYALAELDARRSTEVRAHLDACPACRGALDHIEHDRRVLPPLPAGPAPAPARVPWWRRRWAWSGGLGLAVAAAALLLFVLVRRPGGPGEPGGDDRLVASVRVKGAGLVSLGLVRERDGVISFDARDVRPGDRWKVQLTCAPGGRTWVDVAVYQPGQPTSFPLEPHPLACGNDVVVPGAFRITGGAATVCVAFSPAPPGPGTRRALPARPSRALACVSLTAAAP